MPRIEAMYLRPADVQEECFKELISLGESTEWGKKYGYSDIRNSEDFRKNVPISTYEELFPYIDRMMRLRMRVMALTAVRAEPSE